MSPVAPSLLRRLHGHLRGRLHGRLLGRLGGHERDDRRRQALQHRMAAVLRALGVPASAAVTDGQLQAILAAQLRSDRPDVMWLTLATLTATLPTTPQVHAACRTCDFDGPARALADIVAAARPEDSPLHGLRGDVEIALGRGRWADVEIATGEVLVDLHHTSQTDLATGIQRVARQAARRWHDEHPLRLVGWTDSFQRMRPLSPAQARVALYGGTPSHPGSQLRGAGQSQGVSQSEGAAGSRLHGAGQSQGAAGKEQPVLVPWHSTYLLPELMTERDRALRLQALVSYSGSRTGAIGFDCVPLTSAETIGDGMGAAFAVNLTAIARMDRVVTISQAAAVEYTGWRSMLGGAGLVGPHIEAIPLAVEATVASADAIVDVRHDLCVGTVPMVLVVGSHEPRKNHLAVLHAAEMLWREGRRFSLAFVGGNAWMSDRFTQRLAELQSVGRPVQGVSALSDEMLWAAYAVARCVIFPSLNEGFGLPVAESLASGTPVITSNLGSMAEIARNGGALLVDPSDDAELTDALRRLLTDDALHARLAAQAAKVPIKTWDRYASEVWHSLVEATEGLTDDSAGAPAPALAASQNGIL